MARLTGLEPATPGVTGRYSNQLSYNRASACPAKWMDKRASMVAFGCRQADLTLWQRNKFSIIAWG